MFDKVKINVRALRTTGIHEEEVGSLLIPIALKKLPYLNPELYRLLLQLRLYPIIIKEVIETAYLQINMEEEHRDYLRLIWFTNLFNDEKVKVCKYRFTRVIFGATCSQYLLNATVNKHLQKYANIGNDFVKKVQGKFYVDDLSTGVNTVNEGTKLYKKLRIRFVEAQVKLRKFRTNNKKLRQSFEENVKDANGGKVLGIEWDEFTDKLIFRLNVKPTKRNIFSNYTVHL